MSVIIPVHFLKQELQKIQILFAFDTLYQSSWYKT